jgi:hypothetical protein
MCSPPNRLEAGLLPVPRERMYASIARPKKKSAIEHHS